MRALLDVNILIALLDVQHADHGKTQHWLAENREFGWATCPLTENGCLRILTNAGYPAPLSISEVLAKLDQIKSNGRHEFWPDKVSITDRKIFDLSRMRGHQQMTDVYLLGLAVHCGARFVTLDTRVPTSSVIGFQPGQLVIL